MAAFHVDYRVRLAAVIAALENARDERRDEDAAALELAATVLHQHVGELERTAPALRSA
jgi:hypothetical protein